MKVLLLTLLFFPSARVLAQDSEFKFDPNSPAALAAKAKYETYDRMGKALRTKDLYQELIRLDAINKARLALLSKPEEIFTSFLKSTDDDMRALSYAAVLQKRGEEGDPHASFLYGFRGWDFCLKLQRQNSEDLRNQAQKCWQDLMPAFKRAADAKIAGAAFNIARLYENGFGVTRSKLAAADWYVQSAEQFNREMSRDEALTAVESALNLVEDHPAALRIRKAMLK